MQAKIQIVQNSCQEEIKENNTMKIDLRWLNFDKLVILLEKHRHVI